MLVVPEGGSLLYQNETMVLDGHTGVEHSLPVPNVYKDVVTLFAKSGAGYTPTLIVGYGGLSGENYWYQHTNVWENERLLTFTPRDVIDPRSRRRPMAAEDDFNHVLIAKGAKTDPRRRRPRAARRARPAAGPRRALGAVDAGAGRDDADRGARAAPRSTARATSASTRTSARSRRASSPTSSCSTATRSRTSATATASRMVMVNGRLYDAATLDEIGNHPAARRPFYWER